MSSPSEADDEQKRLSDMLRRADARLKHSQDQQLAQLRSYWNQWNSEERTAFQSWITRVAELKKDLPHVFPYLTMKVEFIEQVGEDEYERISPSIDGMKLAVEHWDRGEDFGPDRLSELL